MTRIGRFFVFTTTIFAGCALPSTPHAEKETPSESIGIATMKADRTVVLQLRATLPDGAIGEGYFEYPQGHSEYRKILEHVGPLSPGQSAPVRPWPEEKKKPNQSPQRNAGAGPATSDEASPPHPASCFERTACAETPRG